MGEPPTWLPFGNPPTLHVATSWYPMRGGEPRYESLCGKVDRGPVEIEPDGTRRCVSCSVLLRRI